VAILKAAGYDPHALARMLQIMESRLPSGGPGFGKTHPDPEDRIASIQGALASAPVPPPAPAARQSRYQAALGKI
jgi:predicted Zn-dependent protease